MNAGINPVENNFFTEYSNSYDLNKPKAKNSHLKLQTAIRATPPLLAPPPPRPLPAPSPPPPSAHGAITINIAPKRTPADNSTSSICCWASRGSDAWAGPKKSSAGRPSQSERALWLRPSDWSKGAVDAVSSISYRVGVALSCAMSVLAPCAAPGLAGPASFYSATPSPAPPQAFYQHIQHLHRNGNIGQYH